VLPVLIDEDPTSLPAHRTIANWANLKAVPDADTSWAHSGLVVTAAGEVIGFHAGQLVAFDEHGDVARILRPGLTEGHGILLVNEHDIEYLWVTDPGFYFAPGPGGGDEAWGAVFGAGVYLETRAPRVVKMTLDGEIVAELPLPSTDPELFTGMMGQYCPCGAAVDEVRFGGSGDIWVADGYGSSLVHRFDRDGKHLLTLTGEEGGGRFLCPHAVFIDRRAGKTPELYIADRENKRVQVYDLAGRFLRVVGEGFLNSPSGFAQWGETLVVAELYSRLAVLDADDGLIAYLGADRKAEEGRSWPERPGWPNALGEDGRVESVALSDQDALNSPHSLAVDADGNLYVSEWLIGGRYTKITPGEGSMSRQDPTEPGRW
jgi:sugar lactone lactonase YvrE